MSPKKVEKLLNSVYSDRNQTTDERVSRIRTYLEESLRVTSLTPANVPEPCKQVLDVGRALIYESHLHQHLQEAGYDSSVTSAFGLVIERTYILDIVDSNVVSLLQLRSNIVDVLHRPE